MSKDNYKWFALALLWVAFFLQQGTRQLFGPSIPAIGASLGVDKVALGVVGTVFAMTYGICVPFAGITADIFNRKWMVTIGVAVFCTGIFVSGFVASAGLLMLTSGLGGRGAGGAEIISYVMSGRWTPGLNIFALTRIVLLIEGAVLAILIVGAVAGLISTMMEAKGRTITKLLGSLLQYIIAIVALFGAFDALGFDTRTLLASLGVFSLAISLGAKDLVSDIFSGVGLVFSGEYQIGDIVQIDGFKGRVWEIGVRSTMLVSMDGHIKNINNRDISNVTNLSRLNTWYTMQISVNYHQPLDQVEDILARELPAIGKNIDEITQGPIYRGITQVGSGKVTLALAAECREQDLTAVRSKLNLTILRLFEHNKISIR
jgi:small-conductance mechanosensitive channel